MVFIDLEKAYDSVPRRLIWDSLECRRVPGKYIDIIRDMYVRSEASVHAPIGDTDFFPVEVGLHQGSALNNILLVTESKQSLNARLEEWRTALEGKGFMRNYRGIKLLGHTMKLLDRLECRGVPRKYIDIIRDMYVRSETSIRAPIGDTNFFSVEVGLHQGSALSPFLFAVVLDELSKLIQETVLWCLLFADDIVLVADSKKSLNARLEERCSALEGKGL
ncbi:uncharacterized protein LOC110924532 [Helianthus annuus]|uniref:uncharacterized protein LOC110924532 n=1 Tax=Helianthus annuus TaxID=4232 RepID=UPI000B8F3BDC|nr:uncharacterized protein LOC110924532 [Helianthus annuus]